MTKDPAMQKDDIVTVEDLIGRVIKLIGPESDDPLAKNVPIEVADVHMGSHKISGKGLAELGSQLSGGYLVGIITVTISGIPFAFGTSAGVIMAGVGVSYFRSRNPNFDGPVNEGARSFLQDFGLNAFVAVLSANVGPKVISALGGDTLLWLALIGIAGALIPPFVAFWVGIKVFGLNAIISDGAATGGRNSTPSLNAIMEESHSSIAAVSYPGSYAFTTVLPLIGGYFSMILS